MTIVIIIVAYLVVGLILAIAERFCICKGYINDGIMVGYKMPGDPVHKPSALWQVLVLWAPASATMLGFLAFSYLVATPIERGYKSLDNAINSVSEKLSQTNKKS